MNNSSLRFAVLTSTNFPLKEYIFAKLLSANLLPDVIFAKENGINQTDQGLLKNRFESLIRKSNNGNTSNMFSEVNIATFGDPEVQKILVEKDIKFAVNLGLGEKLKSKDLLELDMGVISCHPGRLPDYRGSMCPEWALLQGMPIYNSIFKMNHEYDEGPVLLEKEVVLNYPISYEDFRTKIFTEGVELLTEAISSLISSKLSTANFRDQGVGTTFRPMNSDTFNTIKERFFTIDTSSEESLE
ncbi:putative formyltransferase [Candidatus Nanopelagicus limnes]|uniref:Putative formyltransferase n=1 Tax=Candidatus Nanopelagicus limnae TaxID=1884634 RepID=A0A249JZF4_9ACTN|nr:formyltransferase family protein [Candidatus Nanopelagicus limnes]ASY09889.1 putative formyltransferase [Candidatus Nanopelagicus limnes]